jgi:hypothetical protein
MPQQPVSAQPSLAQQPVSAQPSPDPLWNGPDPLGGDPHWQRQPRIEPSPPRARGRRVVPLLVGMVIGLVLFGSGGFVAGYLASPGKDKPTPTPSGTAKPNNQSLPLYESNQLTLNRTKFDGELGALAEPWLSRLGGCSSSADPRGPKLQDGEQTRVFCEYSNVNVYFVLYKSTEARDRVRITRQRQNIDAQVLTPGVAPASQQKTGTSGKSTGAYIEFSYKAGTGADASLISGIWWDRENTPASAYVELQWNEGLGGKWEPLRDLWQRFS